MYLSLSSSLELLIPETSRTQRIADFLGFSVVMFLARCNIFRQKRGQKGVIARKLRQEESRLTHLLCCI